jgi:hypothetical protein
MVADENFGNGGSGRKEPEAHFVRGYRKEDGTYVHAYIRGLGKPSLVFVTVLIALMIAAMSLRVGV